MDAAEMEQQQSSMAASVIRNDHLDFDSLSLIGGLDIQWTDQHRGFAALTVLSWPSLSLMHTECLPVVTQVP